MYAGCTCLGLILAGVCIIGSRLRYGMPSCFIDIVRREFIGWCVTSQSGVFSQLGWDKHLCFAMLRFMKYHGIWYILHPSGLWTVQEHADFPDLPVVLFSPGQASIQYIRQEGVDDWFLLCAVICINIRKHYEIRCPWKMAGTLRWKRAYSQMWSRYVISVIVEPHRQDEYSLFRTTVPSMVSVSHGSLLSVTHLMSFNA